MLSVYLSFDIARKSEMHYLDWSLLQSEDWWTWIKNVFKPEFWRL